jgi:DNA-binding NtrC family response regulator
VKESKSYIESIVITACPSVELVVEAMKLGAADYLIKPVMLNNLERLIRETLPKGKGGHQEGEGLFLF